MRIRGVGNSRAKEGCGGGGSSLSIAGRVRSTITDHQRQRVGRSAWGLPLVPIGVQLAFCHASPRSPRLGQATRDCKYQSTSSTFCYACAALSQSKRQIKARKTTAGATNNQHRPLPPSGHIILLIYFPVILPSRARNRHVPPISVITRSACSPLDPRGLCDDYPIPDPPPKIGAGLK